MIKPQIIHRKTWLAVFLLILVALALRLYRLDFVSLRGDEAFTVIFVQRTWEGLWKGIRLIEPNPPLMYLVLRVWLAIAGTSEFVTRYFSAFFGVLCIPLLYRLACEMFEGTGGRRIALLAAGLIAINPYQVWHSQDVRNYTMWPALSLLALVFFWRWWKAETGEGERRRRAALVLYTLATLTSLYTHYYDTFILVAENIFVFLLAGWGRRWATLGRWIGAQVLLAVTYLPWVLFGTNRITTYGEGSAEKSVPLLDQFSRTLATFVLSDTVPEEWKAVAWAPLALALAAVIFYLASHRAERAKAFFLSLYIAIPTLALFVISIGRPLFLERYLNGIAPGYYLVFAAGLAALFEVGARLQAGRAWKIAASAAFAGGLVFFISTSAAALSNNYFDPAYAKAPDWRALGQLIASHQQPGDIIVQNFNEMASIYYKSSTLPVVTIPRDFWHTPDDEKNLEQINRDYDRIWFIPASGDSWDPIHFTERYLLRHDNLLTETEIPPLRVALYATPRQFASHIIPVNARVGQVTLVGYQGADSNGGAIQISTHSTLEFRLYWRPNEKISKDLHVFIHLVDAAGQVVAQEDRVPAEGTWATPDWIPGELIVDTYHLQIDLNPGSYSLVAGMYDPATMARVPAADANGVAAPENRVAVAPVTVTP